MVTFTALYTAIGLLTENIVSTASSNGSGNSRCNDNGDGDRGRHKIDESNRNNNDNNKNKSYGKAHFIWHCIETAVGISIKKLPCSTSTR